MRFAYMENVYSMSENLNTWGMSTSSGTDEAQCSRKVSSGKRVGGAIMSLANARSMWFSVLESGMSHCWCLFLRMVVRQ